MGLRVSKAVATLGVIVLLAGCGGNASSGSSATQPVTDPAAAVTPEVREAIGAALESAYGKLAGICLASGIKGGDEFAERRAMRNQLHIIIKTASAYPSVKSSAGESAQEILFDVVPTLKGCDEALALEAESAADN
jgi:hypothetical protein